MRLWTQLSFILGWALLAICILLAVIAVAAGTTHSVLLQSGFYSNIATGLVLSVTLILVSRRLKKGLRKKALSSMVDRLLEP